MEKKRAEKEKRYGKDTKRVLNELDN